MSESIPILQLQGIEKSFSGIKVLENIDLDVFPGRVHCLVGENGAGKSTLIKIISGAYQPDTGIILFRGEEAEDWTPKKVLEAGISTIYQEIDIIPVLSVAENIFLGQEPRKPGGSIDRRAMISEAQKLLERIGVSFDVEEKVGKLKIAHQQMVSIAKALNLDSKVLILDEPTAVFTATEVENLFRIITELKRQKIAVVYISHHLEEIFEIGDTITVLKDGKHVTTGPVAEFDHDKLVHAMVGRNIEFLQIDNTENIGSVALELKGLERKGVYSDVSLEVRHGEIVGIAGLVGSGRTEFARSVVGADSRDAGDLFIEGKRWKVRSPGHALKLKLGMLPENRKEEGLALIRPILENAGYSSVVQESRGPWVPWKKVRGKVKDVIPEVKLKYSHLQSETRYLSGGNQQKVVFIKLLGAECDIMILDEPTRGVDVGARADIYKLMQELKVQGKAILMISSDLTEIMSQADRILVMAKGRIVGEMSHTDASEEKILSLALMVGSEHEKGEHEKGEHEQE
ncbi:MAG: sugar ABC transporter ATP-binding protein [Spirochaetota bacterium]